MPHEAIYQYIYALPKDEIAKHGIMLRSKRSSRKPRPNGRKTGARIVVMVSIDDLVTKGGCRRKAGHWEADLIIGARGQSAAVTQAERTTRLSILLALPEGRRLVGLKGYVINIPAHTMRAVEIVAEYHDSWKVEQSFRKSEHMYTPVLSSTTLARPSRPT